MAMYDELTEKRPTKRERVDELYLNPNDPPKLEEAIHMLYEAKRNKKYTKVWIECGASEDEWGHVDYHSIMVMGERPYTDKEWIEDLKLSLSRSKNEKERHMMHHVYFTEGRHDGMIKKMEDKIKELKG
jgi:hypothetical protein